MNTKKLLTSVAVAAALSTAAFSASAATIYGSVESDTFASLSNSGSGPNTFSDWTIGTVTIGSTSDFSGYVWAYDALIAGTGAKMKITNLASVTFTNTSVTNGNGTILSTSGDSFSFKNVAAGTYSIQVSGTLGTANVQKALLGADYTITAVPEPESYAMLLAGLGLMGTIARRRSKAKAN